MQPAIARCWRIPSRAETIGQTLNHAQGDYNKANRYLIAQLFTLRSLYFKIDANNESNMNCNSKQINLRKVIADLFAPNERDRRAVHM